MSRPNILFIMSDDHASHAMSCYGSRINQTPHLDRIADGGMIFQNCFCVNSICTPSRANILTGLHSHLNGVKTLGDPLDGRRPNVAKMLQASGYQTAMVGKWHLGHGGDADPTGFDYWNVLPGQGSYYDPVMIEEDGRKQHEGYATDIITDFSLEWLQNRDRDEPFFLMCHHKAPHRPWDSDEKHANMFEDGDVPMPDNFFDDYANRSNAAKEAKMRVFGHMNDRDLKIEKLGPPPEGLSDEELANWQYQRYIKEYLRCVASIDDNVGRLLDYLDADGVADDTMVIYTSDQGFFLGDHGWYDKRFMYEESLRMPFIVRYPRAIGAGSSTHAMALNIDFAETWLDYAGVPIPDDMQGSSLRPILEGETPDDWRESMYYRYWMHLSHHHVPAHYGIRTHRYKLIYYYGEALGTSGSVNQSTEPEWELFDLEKDPNEMCSVYDDPEYADVVKELTAELYRLKEETMDDE
ncbi:sulfatase [Candidatus Poribacteria bacterium]|nr:MAG: sulfatase [Candidatus Poribacteria bacterium]